MKISPTNRIGSVRFEVNRADEKLLESTPVAKGGQPYPVSFKSILVPIDFSGCSEKALHFAVRFARQFGAKLVLLHVAPSYADAYFVTEFGRLQADVARCSEDRLHALAQEAVPVDVPSQTIVRIGRPASTIVNTAHELGTDLIIISTHGYTGIKHVVFGSTAEDVVRHSPRPVMTIRAKRKKPRRQEATEAKGDVAGG